MTITRSLITDREQWLNWRRKDVTGSEVGALFGLHRFMTPAKLYADKIGALKEDPPSDPMKRGIKLESFVAAQLADKHPNWVIDKSCGYYRDHEHRIGGTPDFLILNRETGQRHVLETKTVGASDFKKHWRGGNAEGEILPEPWHILQNLTYQHLTGFNKDGGIIAALVVGEWEPMDIHEVEVPFSIPAMDRIIEKTGEFWEMVDGGRQPEFNYAKDFEVIKALYASATAGEKADLRFDTEIGDLLEWHERLKDEIKTRDAERKQVEAQIRAKIGDAEIALVNGWDLTLKNQHRRAYSVEATDFRVLRVKRAFRDPELDNMIMQGYHPQGTEK